MSQCDDIRDYLLSGHTITPLEALDMFGCISLGQRVHELKERGWDLQYAWEKKGKKKWKRWGIRGDKAVSGRPASEAEATIAIDTPANTCLIEAETPEDVSSTPSVMPSPKVGVAPMNTQAFWKDRLPH